MFEKTARASLFVYLYYNRDRKKLDSYGDVLYHSKKHRYVQLYLDERQRDDVFNRLQEEKFVKQVKSSPIKELGSNFQGILHPENTTILEK